MMGLHCAKLHAEHHDEKPLIDGKYYFSKEMVLLST